MPKGVVAQYMPSGAPSSLPRRGNDSRCPPEERRPGGYILRSEDCPRGATTTRSSIYCRKAGPKGPEGAPKGQEHAGRDGKRPFGPPLGPASSYPFSPLGIYCPSHPPLGDVEGARCALPKGQRPLWGPFGHRLSESFGHI